MAIAFVQSNFNDSNAVSSTETCAFTSPVTAGNFFLVAINEGTASTQAPTITSVTDNNSNTYHQVFNNNWFYYTALTAYLNNFGLYYAYNSNATPHATPTITVNLASSASYNFNIVIAEFSGMDYWTNPYDQSTYYMSGDGGGGSPFNSAQTSPTNTNGVAGSTITTTFAQELVIGFGGLAGGSSNAITIGGDYTGIHTYNDSTQNYTVGYKIISSIGSPNADFTGVPNPCFAAVATFFGYRPEPGTGFAPRWFGA